VARKIEQGVDLGDGHRTRARGDLHDVLAGAHLAVGQHPQVETRATVRYQQRGHVRHAHPEADAVAGDARLGDLEDRIADPVAVADAHLVVG
jgi:hypothetical protein